MTKKDIENLLQILTGQTCPWQTFRQRDLYYREGHISVVGKDRLALVNQMVQNFLAGHSGPLTDEAFTLLTNFIDKFVHEKCQGMN